MPRASGRSQRVKNRSSLEPAKCCANLSVMPGWARGSARCKTFWGRWQQQNTACSHLLAGLLPALGLLTTSRRPFCGYERDWMSSTDGHLDRTW